MSKHQEDRIQLECVIADLTKELEAKNERITELHTLGQSESERADDNEREIEAKDKVIAESIPKSKIKEMIKSMKQLETNSARYGIKEDTDYYHNAWEFLEQLLMR